MRDQEQPTHERPLHRAIGVLGWLGTITVLVTYYLSMRDALDPASTTFQVLNLGGALSIAGVCWLKRTWQPLALNIAWAGFALCALLAQLT